MLGDLLIGVVEFAVEAVIGAVTGDDEDNDEEDVDGHGSGANDAPAE